MPETSSSRSWTKAAKSSYSGVPKQQTLLPACAPRDFGRNRRTRRTQPMRSASRTMRGQPLSD
jgi:hypothetical protein